MISIFHRRRPKRRGAAAVETAMVLPLALLFTLGIMEYGRYVMTLQIFTNAAREGCRYALTHVDPVTIAGVTYGNNTSDVTNTINNVLGGQTLKSQTVQIFAANSLGTNIGAWSSAESGDCICVQITGNYIPICATYLYMPVTIPLTIRSVMRVEGS